MEEDIKKSLEVLRNGGIILYPTDTIWGIGCDATNTEAVKKTYEIKKRQDSKSMLILLDDAKYLSYYIEKVPDIAYNLIELTNKPLSIIFSGARNIAENLKSSDGSIGIRITQDEFCKKLISKFNKPIVSTSANISGKQAPANFNEIDHDIIEAVDYVVKWRQNDISRHTSSGIIKLGAKGEIQVIRK